jgi:hypothetical protein
VAGITRSDAEQKPMVRRLDIKSFIHRPRDPALGDEPRTIGLGEGCKNSDDLRDGRCSGSRDSTGDRDLVGLLPRECQSFKGLKKTCTTHYRDVDRLGDRGDIGSNDGGGRPVLD